MGILATRIDTELILPVIYVITDEFQQERLYVFKERFIELFAFSAGEVKML